MSALLWFALGAVCGVVGLIGFAALSYAHDLDQEG